MKRVKLVILTYNKFDLMQRAVETALDSTLSPEIIVIDNSPDIGGFKYIQQLLYPARRVFILPMPNLGTSASWNWAMNHYEDDPFVIISNDDIEFQRDTLAKLANRAVTSDAGLIFGSQNDGVPFNLFLLKQKTFRTVGPFDETFRPIYYEDDDFAYRMKLAGLRMEEVTEARYLHVHGGSATLKAYDPAETERHHHRFRWNTEYYARKWGGPPHNETFTTPFNSGEDSKNWHKRQKWELPDKYNVSVSTYLSSKGY